MKKIIQILVLVLPVMFLQQCNNTVSSCKTEILNDDLLDNDYLKCIEAPGLIEADCDSDATFLSGEACVLSLYSKQCDALFGFTFGSGTWYIEGGAVYYGGTSTFLDANATTDCLSYLGTVSSI